jgi:hypothetical protein
MYSVDGQDRVVVLSQLVQPCPGAPCPVILAAEHDLFVAYIADPSDPHWDPALSDNEAGERIAIARFKRPQAHMFGPPNDEAFSGHPLASRGLSPWIIQEVLQSSWIRGLERRNAVHPHHRPEAFSQYRHFVFGFHDSTFECIAVDLSVTLMRGLMQEAARRMAQTMSEERPL